jgi:hypothetical protein
LIAWKFEIHAGRKNDSQGYTFDVLSPNGKRPCDIAGAVLYPLFGDPEGDAQDVHRFPMRHGCLIGKSPLPFRWQFRIGL